MPYANYNKIGMTLEVQNNRCLFPHMYSVQIPKIAFMGPEASCLRTLSLSEIREDNAVPSLPVSASFAMPRLVVTPHLPRPYALSLVSRLLQISEMQNTISALQNRNLLDWILPLVRNMLECLSAHSLMQCLYIIILN